MKIPQPKTFLTVVHQVSEDETGLVACAGFELKSWRHRRLAEHLINWLPHFALRPDEFFKIGGENPLVLLKHAANRIFKSASGVHRGEIGELLLHIIAVTEYGATPFVSRLFYKMRSNDQITGFDSALIVADPSDPEKIELWLGEAKFYGDRNSAIGAAISSIKGHLDAGFLNETKILIGPKIDPQSPSYAQLQWLFDDNNTLDEIIERIVVPVLIACESDAVGQFGDDPSSYPDLVIGEYEYLSERFNKSGIALEVKIVLIYVPLGSKTELEAEFIRKIGAIE